MLLYDGMITMITSLTVYGVLKFLLFKCVYATTLHSNFNSCFIKMCVYNFNFYMFLY